MEFDNAIEDIRNGVARLLRRRRIRSRPRVSVVRDGSSELTIEFPGGSHILLKFLHDRVSVELKKFTMKAGRGQFGSHPIGEFEYVNPEMLPRLFDALRKQNVDVPASKLD
jgi:hypothetical protein